jgi:hypothetical protein
MAVSPERAARLAAQARVLIEAVEVALLQAAARAAVRAARQRDWPGTLLGMLPGLRRRSERQMGVLRRTLGVLVRQLLREAWEQGATAAAADVLAALGRRTVEAQAEEILRRRDPIIRARLEAQARSVEAVLEPALRAAPEILERAFRRAIGQAAVAEHVAERGFRFGTTAQLPRVEAAAREALGGTVGDKPATRLAAAQKALTQLEQAGFRTFTDRAGRRWELASYTEMAVRTVTAQAAVNGALDRFQSFGMDLVIVSDAPAECSLCRPWEGKVLSITGRTPGYPTMAEARAAGLWHPNCRHNVGLFIEGVTRPLKAAADPQGDRDRQRQRALERQVRGWRRRQAAAVTPEEQRRARDGLAGAQARLRAHVQATSPKSARYSNQRTRIGGAR